jgi:hypothetical protein
MGKKRGTADEIVAKLRQVDMLTAQGQTVRKPSGRSACRRLLRDELLKGEIPYTLQEAKVIVQAL